MTVYSLKMTPFLDAMFGAKPAWWDDIYSEYISLRENKNSKYLLTIMKDVAYLQNKIFITAKCIETLWELFSVGRTSKDLTNELKLQGCKGAFDINTRTRYEQDMKAAESHSKRMITSMQRKEKELSDYQAKYAAGEIKRDHFDDWNINIGRFMGFRIDNDLVSVAEWCKLANKYDTYCEVANAEKPENNMLYGTKR